MTLDASALMAIFQISVRWTLVLKGTHRPCCTDTHRDRDNPAAASGSWCRFGSGQRIKSNACTGTKLEKRTVNQGEIMNIYTAMKGKDLNQGINLGKMIRYILDFNVMNHLLYTRLRKDQEDKPCV